MARYTELSEALVAQVESIKTNNDQIDSSRQQELQTTSVDKVIDDYIEELARIVALNTSDLECFVESNPLFRIIKKRKENCGTAVQEIERLQSLKEHLENDRLHCEERNQKLLAQHQQVFLNNYDIF